jgi:hypothetical protein
MDDWDGFYTLAGSTAGTLIGLIFVVITLGIDHTKKGDEHRVRLFVTPVGLFRRPSRHRHGHGSAVVVRLARARARGHRRGRARL